MAYRNRFNLLTAGLLGSALALGACGDDEESPSTDTGNDTADAGGDANISDTDPGGGLTCDDATVDEIPAQTRNTAYDGVADLGTACDAPEATITVDADITEDTTWCAGSTITLDELVFVTNGATLTIEPGTTVLGTDGSALVIATDGKIDARGTADAPIVFTSSLTDDPESGDWGGVVLLGNAEINVTNTNIEGMEASNASAYGGSDNAHDCGAIRYARIEYAGSVFGEDNELNGLTVGGCGSDTVLEYIQVHRGLDDGIEFFGGTASIRYAVVTQAGDDSIDWDQGWRGSAQFLAIQQSSSTGDRGFESDNLGDDNDAAPRSNPTIYNVTMVSAGTNDEQIGMKLRRGTAGEIANAIIYGFDAEAIDIDSEVSANNFVCDTLDISYVLSVSNGDFADETGDSDDDGGFDEATELGAVEGWSTEDPAMGDPENLTAPNFVPAAGGSAANGTATPGGWFDAAPYYGAFEPGGTDWMAGWTSFE